jgi:uncharacterized delta-60 repeat protein
VKRSIGLAVVVTMLAGVAAALPAWAVSLELDPSFSGDGVRPLALERGDVTSLRLDGAQILAAGRYVGASDQRRIFIARLQNDGNLVQNFGNGGVVTRRAPGISADVDMQVLPDGSALTAYNRRTGVVVHKWTPDGELDPSFSADGERLVPMTITGRFDPAAQIAVDTQERIVVAGMEQVENGFNTVIARLTPSGATDKSLSKNGRVTVNLGNWDWPDALVTDAEDRILLGSDYWQFRGTRFPEHGVVIRLRPRGELDTSFSGDGIVRFKMLSGGVNYPAEIGIGRSGAVTVAAVAGDEAYGAVRLSRNGRFDRDYGHDGVLSINCECALFPASVDAGRVAFSGFRGFVESEGEIDWTSITVRISRDGTNVDRRHFDLFPDRARNQVDAVLIDDDRTLLGGRAAGEGFVARLGRS